MDNHANRIVMPDTDECFEITGYRNAKEVLEAFKIGYEIGREDAADGDPLKPCGALPAQRAGYCFGYVGEIEAQAGFEKWLTAERII